MGYPLAGNKINTLRANPLSTFYVLDPYHRKTETLATHFYNIPYYNTTPPPSLERWGGMVGKKRSKPEYHCLCLLCLSLRCACCSSVHVAPNRQLLALQTPKTFQPYYIPFPYKFFPRHLTQTPYSKLLNISLCYIWRKNCGINLRSKIMPTRHTHDTKG